ncbi:hypothetical protein P256_01491 [Acinetobacter nectaris CIP 110549]|uniref:Uncharacterized protein n=1 Tax=Acinetobacter nectaris CIP 110549 TaxID=1392540 RepID=V2UTJ9_9GAMM|nr:hypothetical protein [Acinetobacter nectaris]ESK38674.1 hypothetical protein P256_01491 [Acinetobacter nectaris CIP 110549]
MLNKRVLCFAVMCLGLQTGFAATSWPPETGAKVVGNALEYPTTLSGQQKSMTDFLNHGAKIINTQMGERGPIFTLQQGKKFLLCFIYPANPETDQNVATSKCYGLN